MNRSSVVHPVPWVVSVLVLLGTGCVSQSPFVSRASGTTHRLELVPSPRHDFKLVRIDDSDGVLTVYGKVRHLATHCEHEAHVDMTITPPSAQPSSTVGLPLRKVGHRRRGWAGAAFRVRRPGNLPAGTEIRLAFHEPNCASDGTFVCEGTNSEQ